MSIASAVNIVDKYEQDFAHRMMGIVMQVKILSLSSLEEDLYLRVGHTLVLSLLRSTAE